MQNLTRYKIPHKVRIYKSPNHISLVTFLERIEVDTVKQTRGKTKHINCSERCVLLLPDGDFHETSVQHILYVICDLQGHAWNRHRSHSTRVS